MKVEKLTSLSKNIIGMLNKETLPKPKILLIEDCKCDTVLIKHIMSEYYPFTDVDNATTKSEAFENLDKNEYDLVLLDLNLPDTEGLGDIGEIRMKCASTPLIIITGAYNEHSISAAVQFGANGIIGKGQLIGISFYSAMQQAIDNIDKVANM